MRQVLCSLEDFEPYTAFKRIDRGYTGTMDNQSLCQFLRESGFRELCADDMNALICYFDLDCDGKLNYHDFLQVLLPCNDQFLRAAATQRPMRMDHESPIEFLPARVEKALSQLFYQEVRY